MATAFDNVMSSVRTYLGYDPMGPDNPYRGRRNRAIEVGRALVALGISGGAYNYFKNKILGTNTMYRPKRPAFGRRRRTRRSTKKKQYKGSKTRKSRKTFRRTKPSLRKEVKQIKRQLNADSARHVYKQMVANQLVCTLNAVNYTYSDVITCSNLETFASQLRYYDPAVPGTLVTAPGGTGTFQRELYFKSVSCSVDVRNNYQVPVKVKVYLCKPKGDTNIAPTTYYTNSITDQLIGGGGLTTPGVYPTDLVAFTSQWSIKCLKDVTLDAGAYFTVSHKVGPFRYDPSLVDSHALEYQPKYKSFAIMFRVEGVVGHDTAAAQYTTLPAGIDYSLTNRAEIIYDAGVILDDIYVSNLRSGTFTNGGVVTNKPIADNQGYSLA